MGGPVCSPHRLAATCQPTTTANGSRSGGVALLRPSRSALRRSSLGHGHGQAIGARMHGSAPWKTEETIVGLPRLLVLSALSRSDSPDLVAVTFHLSRRIAFLDNRSRVAYCGKLNRNQLPLESKYKFVKLPGIHRNIKINHITVVIRSLVKCNGHLSTMFSRERKRLTSVEFLYGHSRGNAAFRRG